MPSFRVVEVPAGDSFEKITPVMLNAWSNPRDPSFEFLGGKYTRKQMSSALKDNPNSRYVTVVDDNHNGTVVSGANFYIYESNDVNPHVKRPPWPPTISLIDWYPEGRETRKFVAALFEYGLAISREKFRRPHIFITVLFTVPEYRKMGAATMLVNWGVEIADKLGLETFIYAERKIAAHIYQKAGYLTIDETVVDMNIPYPNEEWKACQKQLGEGYGWLNMWRPVGGKWEDGAKYPWELEKENENENQEVEKE